MEFSIKSPVTFKANAFSLILSSVKESLIVIGYIHRKETGESMMRRSIVKVKLFILFQLVQHYGKAGKYREGVGEGTGSNTERS